MTTTQRRTAALFALAALGATGMFLGPDGWFGIDIGATGAALLYLAVVVFLAHLARHGEAAFPEDVSLAERQAWVSLVFVALIALHFVNYLTGLHHLGEMADRVSNPASRRFGISLGMLIFGWIAVAGVLRKQNREAVELDERDMRVHHAAARLASGLMAMMMIGLVVLIAWYPEQSRAWMRPVIVGSALIGLLIARSLAEYGITVVKYRLQRA
jgi:hypothetical protein